MKISYKIIAFIIAFSFVLLGFGNWLFSIIFTDFLVNQEDKQIDTNVNSLISNTQEKRIKYESVANDWGHWDDTYDYIQTNNAEYVKSNLSEDSIGILNTNFIMIYDNNNTEINKFYLDLNKKEFVDFPVDLVRNVEEHLKDFDKINHSSFLLENNNNFYIIAISEITDSLKQKPSNGKLIVGRLIDQSIITDLEKITNSKIIFSSIENDLVPDLIRKEGDKAKYTTIDNNTTITNILVPNLNTKDTMIIAKMIKIRDFYTVGISQLRTLQTAYSIFIFIIIVVIYISIRLFISKPILNLSNFLKGINLSNKRFERLPEKGSFEFRIITEAINNMLGKIEIEHKNYRRSEKRLKMAQSIAHIGNWEFDINNNELWASQESIEIFGINNFNGELTYELIKSYICPKYHFKLEKLYADLIDEKIRYFEIEYSINSKEERFIYMKAELIYNNKGKPSKVVGIIYDITDRKKYEEEILYNSFHDSLTNLYNRRFLDKEMEKITSPENLPISIIIGDVNGLKLANDIYGHQIGDSILQKTSEMLKNISRPNDIVARWGGDEFVLILPNTDKADVEKIINKIHNECAKISVKSIKISISLGYDTKYTIDQDIAVILKNAEDYMYKHKTVESASMRSNSINMILKTLHEKNLREEQHSRRVSKICMRIGEAMEFNDSDLNKLRVIGLVHDIGKIGINENILNKPGKLTEEEWDEMKRHPEIGCRILSSTSETSDLSLHVISHHERLDGKGYPNGIKGDEISVFTKILSIADSYDAMTSKRAYRDGMSKEDALKELQKNVDTQFDAKIVDIFINKVIPLNDGDFEV